MKASALAKGISAVMWGYLVALVANVLAALVLAVGNVRARNVPPGGPIARLR
jgi:hydroxymethylglutaryl-CoA reductase